MLRQLVRRFARPAALVALATGLAGLHLSTGPASALGPSPTPTKVGGAPPVVVHGRLDIPTPGLQPTVIGVGPLGDRQVGPQHIDDPTSRYEVPFAPVVMCGAYDAGERGAMGVVSGLTPGRVFALTADRGSWQDDFDIVFFDKYETCPNGGDNIEFRYHPGDEHGVVPPNATAAVITLNTGRASADFTFRELPDDPYHPLSRPRSPTVVAVIEPGGFSPYHFDFAGWRHPWNQDANPANDINFADDPATYIAGYPAGAIPAPITVPTTDVDVSGLAAGADKPTWSSMQPSVINATNTGIKMYRFPKTKIVGALMFGTNSTPFYPTEGLNSHATRAASVSGGNIHGTCAECVFVLIKANSFGAVTNALQWVADQSWIDVVTNSYAFDTFSTTAAGHPITSGDTIETDPAPVPYTKAGTSRGQTLFFGAGNGSGDNVTNNTYLSSLAGPDWPVTVGAISANNDQSLSGSGAPADIASYGESYPSLGGTTANGTGGFSGTSNATPVVAGTYARVLQLARDLVGDQTAGHANGEVARGVPVRCPTVHANCPLDDGVLTRKEAQALLFSHVLPSPTRQPATDEPVTKGGSNPLAATVTQGHGIVYGILDRARFAAEQRTMSDALQGVDPAWQRPPGEVSWMTTDSKCRQHLWGPWGEGYFTPGSGWAPDPTTDPKAAAVDDACAQLSVETFNDPLDPPITWQEIQGLVCPTINTYRPTTCQ